MRRWSSGVPSGASFAKNENPALRVSAKGGVSGTLMCGRIEGYVMRLRLANSWARQRFLTERPAQTSPPAEVFGVIEPALRSHFAKEIPV